MLKQLFWLLIWGTVFGYMEAAVVVYLREIYYPEGFIFPAVIIPARIMLVEIVREAATLLIIWATVSLTYKRVQSQIAAFVVLFGVWDIFYYIFLKLILNWPENLAAWDILFLIPMPWIGPVWAPLLVSVLFIYAGISVLIRNQQDHFIHFGKSFIVLEFFSALFIIISFLIPGSSVLEQSIPKYFPWYLFLTGLFTGICTFLYFFFPLKK